VSLYGTIADALLYFAQQVVASYERKLREKETEMADLRQQIKAMQDKIRKLDEVQASAAELLHRYNELVKQNADNKAALDELTAEFDREIDETVAAITENTEVEEPEEDEGDDPFTPSGNTPTGGSKSGAGSGKKSSSKGKK
jgi:seryl-tRNA synthetase